MLVPILSPSVLDQGSFRFTTVLFLFECSERSLQSPWVSSLWYRIIPNGALSGMWTHGLIEELLLAKPPETTLKMATAVSAETFLKAFGNLHEIFPKAEHIKLQHQKTKDK